MAVTLGGIDSAEILVMTHGLEVPNASGLAGGFPGATVRQRFGRGVLHNGEYPANLLPHDPQDIAGEWLEWGPKPGLMPMTKEDVFAVLWQGGGGWGDPLERDPIAVCRDLRNGILSEKAAHTLYGVICTEQGEVDEDATQTRRRQVRQERIGKKPTELSSQAREGFALGPALRLVRTSKGWQVRSRAGYVLTTGTTAWRANALARPIPQEMLDTLQIRLHPRLTMTAFYCPLSGDQLAVDVHIKGEQPVDDVLLDLTSFEKLQNSVL